MLFCVHPPTRSTYVGLHLLLLPASALAFFHNTSYYKHLTDYQGIKTNTNTASVIQSSRPLSVSITIRCRTESSVAEFEAPTSTGSRLEAFRRNTSLRRRRVQLEEAFEAVTVAFELMKLLMAASAWKPVTNKTSV